MRVVAPVHRVGEVELLAASGADEFYCGLIPREWHVKYTVAVWINRRGPQGGNLFTFESLRELTAAAHRLGRPVFLALNAPYYTGDQMPDVEAVARRAVEDAGVDGLLVSDLGLIRRVRDLRLPVELHLSSVAHVLNEQAARFYAEAGVDRIILPRHLRSTEITRIVTRNPDIRFECFVLNDGCVYEEGFCLTAHNADRLHAFCRHPWTVAPRTRRESRRAFRDWRDLVADYRRFLEESGSVACAGGPVPQGAPAPCGLCALHRFAQAGVHGVKIVGREASTTKKVRSVDLVSRVVKLAKRGLSERDLVTQAVEVRGDAASCLRGWACYYRDAWRPDWIAAAVPSEGP